MGGGIECLIKCGIGDFVDVFVYGFWQVLDQIFGLVVDGVYYFYGDVVCVEIVLGQLVDFGVNGWIVDWW